MKYQLKPHFKIEDEKLGILSTEITNYSIEELDFIIKDINNVLSNTYEESFFSGNVSSVLFRKDFSRILYFDTEIERVPTSEILEMLVDYANSLKDTFNKS